MTTGLGYRRSLVSWKSPPALYGLAALAALSLSLAAALFAGLGAGQAEPVQPPFEVEIAARADRIAFFERRASADPIDAIALNALAGQYLQRAREQGGPGDYARAHEAASRSLALLPDDNYAGLTAMAAVKLAQHEFREALSLAERAITLKPREAAAHGLKGDALLQLGRYDEARKAYEGMALIEGALPALSRLAGLSFVVGDSFNAEDYWKQAISASGGLPRENMAWARAQLGHFYLNQGRTSAAEKQYRQALRMFPDYYQANAGIASVRAAEGRYEEAANLLQGVLNSRPEPQYAALLGDIYAAQGRTSEAAAQYALVEAMSTLLTGNGVNSDLSLAYFYADHANGDAEKLRQARELAENAYLASPNVYSADALAWALFRNGQLAEAGRLAEEALRLGTPEASFYFHAGAIRAAQGQQTQARQLLERAFAINPHFAVLQEPEARSLLLHLKEASQ